MAPLPKRRHSSRRQGKREAAIHYRIERISQCPKCGANKQSHRACPKCGFYKDTGSS